MCGIAGYYSRNHYSGVTLVRAMNDVIRHRGPDDEGFHVDGGCAIGMRRLAIIDLNTGHQPVSNEDGTVWVVFNGEVYNFQELRKDLLAAGHRFRTNSDTEVLVHLYEQEGVAGIAKLRGMFAYAIWDARDRSLLLVRDRFGKKPLYYAVLGDGIYFGSEIKCLAAAGVPDEIDEKAIQLYFQLGYIPDPLTAYGKIRKMMPGTWMRYESNARVTSGTWWKMPVPARSAPAACTQETAAARVRELFDDAVRMRMLADVPLGAFLSGGLDSASVVASMARQSTEPVKTFSIGFEEAEFNELPAARMVAEQYGTEHHEILVHPDSVELVEKLVHHFDEPFADSSAIPTFLVSQFAAQHVKVALSGDGGDEFFAGYPTIPDVLYTERFDRWPWPVRQALGWVADRLPYSAYGRNYLRMASRGSALERYFERNYAPWYLRQSLVAKKWLFAADAARYREEMPDFILRNGDMATVAQYFEATSNLTGDILVKVDRMSMANSLEVRCPLLDDKVVEFASSLPLEWKLSGGKGKQILRKALAERLPPALLSLPKKGFGVPLAAWFRGGLRQYLWDHLGSRECRERGVMSPPFVLKILNEHQSGRRDNSAWLWRMLMLELWFLRRDRGTEAAEVLAGGADKRYPGYSRGE